MVDVGEARYLRDSWDSWDSCPVPIDFYENWTNLDHSGMPSLAALHCSVPPRVLQELLHGATARQLHLSLRGFLT